MEGFKFEPFKTVDQGRAALGYTGKSTDPMYQWFGVTPGKGETARLRQSMDSLIGTAREFGVGDSVINQLTALRNSREQYYDLVPLLSMMNFQSLFQSSTQYVKTTQEKKAEEAIVQQETQQNEALEAQRAAAQRVQNYATNVGSGNLAGPGDQPTLFTGGSQNIDSTRLAIGSSTARRRRGRGISAQLGL